MCSVCSQQISLLSSTQKPVTRHSSRQKSYEYYDTGYIEAEIIGSRLNIFMRRCISGVIVRWTIVYLAE